MREGTEGILDVSEDDCRASRRLVLHSLWARRARMREPEPGLVSPSQEATSEFPCIPVPIDAIELFDQLKNGLGIAGVGDDVAAIMRETVFENATKRWQGAVDRLRALVEGDP